MRFRFPTSQPALAPKTADILNGRYFVIRSLIQVPK
jgi:hypothetical protein